MGGAVSQRGLNSKEPIFGDDNLEGISDKLPEINKTKRFTNRFTRQKPSNNPTKKVLYSKHDHQPMSLDDTPSEVATNLSRKGQGQNKGFRSLQQISPIGNHSIIQMKKIQKEQTEDTDSVQSIRPRSQSKSILKDRTSFHDQASQKTHKNVNFSLPHHNTIRQSNLLCDSSPLSRSSLIATIQQYNTKKMKKNRKR